MATVAEEGYGHYTSRADWSLKGNNYTGSNITFNPTGGRGGRGCVQIAVNSEIRKVLSAAQTTVFHHFYFNAPGRFKTQLAAYRNAECDNVLIEALEDGSIRAYRSSSLFGQNPFSNAGAVTLGTSDPGVWDANVDHHCQIKVTISSTVGEVTIKIDDAEVLSLTNKNTYSGTGAVSITQVGHGTDFGLGTVTYGDFVVTNTSGSVNNSFLGDVAVYEVVAPVDGDELDWDRSSGAGTWSSHVDSNPQTGDTEYLGSAVNGNRNCFSFPAIAGTVGAVLSIKETICLRKEDATYGAVKLYSRSTDNVDHDGDTETAAQSYSFKERIYDQDLQDDTNWTVAKVNATQLGFVDVS